MSPYSPVVINTVFDAIPLRLIADPPVSNATTTRVEAEKHTPALAFLPNISTRPVQHTDSTLRTKENHKLPSRISNSGHHQNSAACCGVSWSGVAIGWSKNIQAGGGTSPPTRICGRAQRGRRPARRRVVWCRRRWLVPATRRLVCGNTARQMALR